MTPDVISLIVWHDANEIMPTGKPRYVLVQQNDGIVHSVHTSAPAWAKGSFARWAEIPLITNITTKDVGDALKSVFECRTPREFLVLRHLRDVIGDYSDRPVTPDTSPFNLDNDRDWETDPDGFYEAEHKLREAGFVFARRLTSAFIQKVRDGGHRYAGHEIEADFAVVPMVAPDGYLDSDEVRWFTSWQGAYADWRDLAEARREEADGE